MQTCAKRTHTGTPVKTISAALAILGAAANAALEPVSPVEAIEELRENHIALVETTDPFTDQTTLSLQLIGFDSEEMERKFREFIRAIEEQTQTLKAATEAGVAVSPPGLPPMPEWTKSLFVMECNPTGELLAVPLVTDEASSQSPSLQRFRVRVDADPMMELTGAVDHDGATALLNRLIEANGFIVQRHPPTAGDQVFTFRLYVESEFDRRLILREFENRCSARGR